MLIVEPIKVGINGFGRIGSLTYRVLESKYVQNGEIEVAAVNDLASPEEIADYLRNDSVFRKFPGDISHDAKNIIVNGKKIEVLSFKQPSELPWKDKSVDIVLESTGLFTKKESPKGGYLDHIKQGAKYVVLSAPASDDGAKTIVLGVNFNPADLDNYQAISNASCTTNCWAPIVYVLDKEFGIKKGSAVTIHAYTNDQKLVDSYHKDKRRRRAAAQNIIPTTTGAAAAIVEIFPHLKGKIYSYAIRVPVVNGSMVHFTAELEKDPSAEEVNSAMKDASMTYSLEGILEYSNGDLVSSDIIENPHSSIFDSKLTSKEGANNIKVASWYDNEWGYSNRAAELIVKIAEHLKK